jgi:hypothetical protein
MSGVASNAGNVGYGVLTGGREFKDQGQAATAFYYLRLFVHWDVPANHVVVWRAYLAGETVDRPFAFLGGPQMGIPEQYAECFTDGEDDDNFADTLRPVIDSWSKDPTVHRCVFVFAGHGQPKSIQLGQHFLTGEILRDLLLPVASKPILVILDACFSTLLARTMAKLIQGDSAFTAGVWFLASGPKEGATSALVFCRHESIPIHPNGDQFGISGSMFHRAAFQVFLYLLDDCTLNELAAKLNAYQPSRAGFYAAVVASRLSRLAFLREFMGPPIDATAATADQKPGANHPPLAPNHPPLAPNHPLPATARRQPAPNHPPLAPNHPPLAPNHPPLAPNHPPLAPNHPPLAPSNPATRWATASYHRPDAWMTPRALNHSPAAPGRPPTRWATASFRLPDAWLPPRAPNQAPTAPNARRIHRGPRQIPRVVALRAVHVVREIERFLPRRPVDGFFDDICRTLEGDESGDLPGTLPGGELDPVVWVHRCVHCQWDPLTNAPKNVEYGRLQGHLDGSVFALFYEEAVPRGSVDVGHLLSEVEDALQQPPTPGGYGLRAKPPTPIQRAVELHQIANYIRVTNGFAVRNLGDYWKLAERFAPYLERWSAATVRMQMNIARVRLLHP